MRDSLCQASLRLHDDDEKSAEDFAVFQEKNPMDLRKRINMYYMNPNRATRSIINHFPSFITRLKSTKNTMLKQKFNEFCDDFYDE